MPPARPKTPIKSALKDFVIAFAVFLSFATLIWAEQASSGGTRLDVWVAAQFTTEQAITTSAGVPTPEGTAAAASDPAIRPVQLLSAKTGGLPAGLIVITLSLAFASIVAFMLAVLRHLRRLHMPVRIDRRPTRRIAYRAPT